MPVTQDRTTFNQLQYQLKARFNTCQFCSLIWLEIGLHGLELLLKLQQLFRHDAPLSFCSDTWSRYIDLYIDPFQCMAPVPQIA